MISFYVYLSILYYNGNLNLSYSRHNASNGAVGTHVLTCILLKYPYENIMSVLRYRLKLPIINQPFNQLCFKALFSLLYVSTSLAENLKYESWKNIFVPAVYINQNNWKELGKDSSQVANSVLVNDSLVGFLI